MRRTNVLQPPIPWEIDREALGLEFGPLDKPRLDKSMFNVLYVDHLPTDALQAKYERDPNVSVVQPVDVVWPGHGFLVGALPSATPIEYVVASHGAEHVPNLVGWLGALSSVMAPGGFVALILPDKRYCFDVRRSETRVWHLVDARLRDARAPTFQQIYEFNASIVPVDTQAIWRGDPGFSDSDRTDVGDVDEFSLRMCEEQQRSGDYVDVHCWAFTPAGFADCYERLSKLGLVDLGLERIDPTPVGSLEFYVTLRKPRESEGPDWLLRTAKRARAGMVEPAPVDRARSTDLSVLRDDVDDVNRELATLSASVARIEVSVDRVMGVLRRLRHPVRTLLGPGAVKSGP